MQLRPLQARHTGPHQRAVHTVVAQHLQAFVIARVLQPSVHAAPGQVRPPTRLQVHRQKGQVGHAVNPAQIGVELQRIKQLRLAVNPGNVGQVQIAMALAHMTTAPALGPHALQRMLLGGAPLLQPLQGAHLPRRHLGQHQSQSGQAFTHRCGGSMLGRWRRQRPAQLRHVCHSRLRVQPGHLLGQGVHVFVCHASRLQPAAEQGLLVKAAHQHRGLRPCGIPCRPGLHPPGPGLAAVTHHAHHVQVHVRGRAAVDAQLFLARGQAQCGRAEVQKIQRQRLLEFVHMPTHQQQPRDVRFDALHRTARIAPGLRVVLQLMHALLRSGVGILQCGPDNARLRRGVGRNDKG